jgi:hypothetical protein
MAGSPAATCSKATNTTPSQVVAPLPRSGFVHEPEFGRRLYKVMGGSRLPEVFSVRCSLEGGVLHKAVQGRQEQDSDKKALLRKAATAVLFNLALVVPAGAETVSAPAFAYQGV